MAVSLASFWARFINVKDTEELKAAVNEIIPLKENQFKIINVQGSVKKFKATIECKIESEKEFIESYQQKSTETVRKLTPKYPGEKSMYRKCVYFRCHHNTRYQATMNSKEKALKNPSHRFKNTDCPFSMVIKFKRIGEDDDAIVELEWTHNHPIKSLQTLSFRDIREDISAEIFNLFENNFTPGLAYREFSRKAKENSPSEIEFHKQISDRSVFPRRTDYNYLYTEYHRSKFGTKCTETMFQKLNTLVVEKTLADPETTLKFQKFSSVENDPFILVIITPLMKRVHEKVRSSGEMVFFDSSGGMEEYNLRVFVMVTHSFVGALPLGIVVTSDETTDTLTRALEMFSSSLPDFAFYGKGALNGPGVIMTDNCDELKDALHATWPRSRLLLCIFHLMQQVWRWLFDKKHDILQADRPAIMMKFRKIVYSDIEEQTDEFFNDLLEDCRDIYPKLKSYLITLFEIKERWCMCFRNNLMLRGNNTNNYVEAQFLVLKDNILNRTKEVNINGLLEKLTKDFNNYYKLKITNLSC